MRELNVSELVAVSGADISLSSLVGLWTDAGLYSGANFNYDLASKGINDIGLASATEQKGWNHSVAGEAGWLINSAGEKVTWFNNGVFMAFQIG